MADGTDLLETIYQTESRRILATLIRLLGDFDLAEEALQDAFQAALEHWPKDGPPAYPRAWLVSAGRFKAIDRLRRRGRFDRAIEAIAAQSETGAEIAPGDIADDIEDDIEDDRLRLIFTCCHPALSPEARIALTLREGLRPDHRGDRSRIPHNPDDARAARQGQDPHRRHSLPDTGRGRARPAPRHGALRHLPYFQ